MKKSKKDFDEKLKKIENNTLLKWLGAVLLLLIGALLTYYIEKDEPTPVFDLKTSIINPKEPITIEAKNDAAKKKKPLNVRIDGLRLNEEIPPSPIEDKYEWQFKVSDLENQGFRHEHLIDRTHSIEVGFNSIYQKISDVYIDSKPPITQISISSFPQKPNDRIIKGYVADERQDPEESIKVDIVFLSGGSETSIQLPVERNINEKGLVYFEFETLIKNIPKISPNDSAFHKNFFGFRIMDKAGNYHTQIYSYAQFSAPGYQSFATGNIADIVLKKDIDIEKKTLRLKFSVKPSDLWQTKFNGELALPLKVYAHTKKEIKLEWNNLPEEIRAVNPITAIYRNDGKLEFVIGAESYLDKSVPENQKIVYQIAQSDKYGEIFKSNKVLLTQPKLDNFVENEKREKRSIFVDIKLKGKDDITFCRGIISQIKSEFEKNGLLVNDKKNPSDYVLMSTIYIENNSDEKLVNPQIPFKISILDIKIIDNKATQKIIFPSIGPILAAPPHSSGHEDAPPLFSMPTKECIAMMKKNGIFNFLKNTNFIWIK